jgi:hypothetical protein
VELLDWLEELDESVDAVDDSSLLDEAMVEPAVIPELEDDRPA